MQWEDPYYQLPPEKMPRKEEVVHYSSHPEIGRRATNFPDPDLSLHGVMIARRNLPRWTPEIKFLYAEEPPAVIREEYSVDRTTGVVTCYFEATGTFARTRAQGMDNQELTLGVTTEHRSNVLHFAQHSSIRSKIFASPISDWTFDHLGRLDESEADLKADFSSDLQGGTGKKYDVVEFKADAKRIVPWWQRWAHSGLDFLGKQWGKALLGGIGTTLVGCYVSPYLCEGALLTWVAIPTLQESICNETSNAAAA